MWKCGSQARRAKTKRQSRAAHGATASFPSTLGLAAVLAEEQSLPMESLDEEALVRRAQGAFVVSALLAQLGACGGWRKTVH